MYAATFRRPPKARCYEANLEALDWLERIARALEAGFVFTIDYGYTRAESIRFPRGTLMSYRRHGRMKTCLPIPARGTSPLTSAFTALQEHGARLGLATVRFETLAQTLLAAGEADQFAAALAADNAPGRVAAAIAVEEPVVRDGGDLPDAVAEAGRRSIAEVPTK